MKAYLEAKIGKLEKDVKEARESTFGRSDQAIDLTALMSPYDQKLIQKAIRLDFIDTADLAGSSLFHCKEKDKTKKGVLVKDESGSLKVEDESIMDRENLKWLEWLSRIGDIIDLYLVHGGHVDRLKDFLKYYRTMQILGKDRIFTFESLQKADRYIRSRPQGQGKNFV